MGPGRPHPGVGMVLPGLLDLRRAGPADIWPQAPRGLAQRPCPTFPQAPPVPAPASTPCSSSHSPWRFLLYFLSPMSLTHLHDWFLLPENEQCTHSYMLYTVTRAHTHPHKLITTRSHAPRNTYTPAHTQGSHTHACAHIPICPDTHKLYLSLTLIHSHTHVP